jgi:hypothetical protein
MINELLSNLLLKKFEDFLPPIEGVKPDALSREL